MLRSVMGRRKMCEIMNGDNTTNEARIIESRPISVIPALDKWLVYWYSGTEWRCTECDGQYDAASIYRERIVEGFAPLVFHLADDGDEA